jgi:hypothetical protein
LPEARRDGSRSSVSQNHVRASVVVPHVEAGKEETVDQVHGAGPSGTTPAALTVARRVV